MRTTLARTSLACSAALLAGLALATAGGLTGVAAPASGASAPELIAYSSHDWRTGTGGLSVVRPDGTGNRRLTGPGAYEDTAPAWSPKGTRLAFGRMDGRGWRLYVGDASARRLTPLTPYDALAGMPSWSPDGRFVAFERLPKDLPKTGSFAQQVFVVGAGGGRVRQLTAYGTFRGGAGDPDWSPDGRRILFSGRRSAAEGGQASVFVVNRDGSRLRELIRNAWSPAWSPDGTKIAFVRRWEIHTADAQGRGVHRVTRVGEESGVPTWSPDGRRIAFEVINRERDPDADTSVVAVVNLDGSGLREITRRDPNVWRGAPDWRPAPGR